MSQKRFFYTITLYGNFTTGEQLSDQNIYSSSSV